MRTERRFLVFAHRLCRNLALICLRSTPARRPARSWVQRAEAVLWSWNLSLVEFVPFIYGFFGFVRNAFHHTPRPAVREQGFRSKSWPGGRVGHSSVRHGVETVHTNLRFVFFVGAGAFFSVFRLLVALNIMSGDLKLCRECVNEFLWQASSQEEALLMLSLKKKIGFLHNFTITWMSVCQLWLSIRKLRHVCFLFLGCLYFSFFGKRMCFCHFVTCWNWTEFNQDSFFFSFFFFFFFVWHCWCP